MEPPERYRMRDPYRRPRELYLAELEANKLLIEEPLDKWGQVPCEVIGIGQITIPKFPKLGAAKPGTGRIDKHRKCEDCDGPISYSAGRRCGKCFENERLRIYEEMVEAYNSAIVMYMALTKRNGRTQDAYFGAHAITDFAPELIARISRLEEQYDLAFVFWGQPEAAIRTEVTSDS